ncbi:TetR/AcrR family transcriptional regulator [Saccharomonospora sp. NPDC046836]|uniref:TetR/AcrR family transcriptional regulator n=1 Tax=Saccharomonospora sp. NPDC046836 TaxID=3156921 RepID=UPI0033CEF45B
MAQRRESPLRARMRVWDPEPVRSRGPAPAYSRDQIADAGIDIADEQGIDAVSMRKVAARLGTGAMSLYRYVDSKEGLVELMADRMLGRANWPELSGDWREDLRTIIRGHRVAVLAHPWLSTVWAGRPAFGPNMLRGFERAMSIMDGLGLSIDEMFETIGMVNTWVDGFVRNELAVCEYFGSVDEAEVQRSMGPYVESVIRSGDYPYFSRVVIEAKTPHVDPDIRFERSLDRVIAGIEATLPQPPHPA